MSGFLEKFSFFAKTNDPQKNKGPELHIQRMKRIQKILGNITDKELKLVEDRFENFGQRYNYPVWEVSSLFEWLYKSYSIKNLDTIYYDLEKAIKTARNLGRSNLKLKKSDLEGVLGH